GASGLGRGTVPDGLAALVDPVPRGHAPAWQGAQVHHRTRLPPEGVVGTIEIVPHDLAGIGDIVSVAVRSTQGPEVAEHALIPQGRAEGPSVILLPDVLPGVVDRFGEQTVGPEVGDRPILPTDEVRDGCVIRTRPDDLPAVVDPKGTASAAAQRREGGHRAIRPEDRMRIGRRRSALADDLAGVV